MPRQACPARIDPNRECEQGLPRERCELGPGARRHQSESSGEFIRQPAGAERLRQVDAAQAHRRHRKAVERRHSLPCGAGRRHQYRRGLCAAGARPVSLDDAARQHRVSAEDRRGSGSRAPPQGDGMDRAGEAWRLRAQVSAPALRRDGEAGLDGAGAHHRQADPADGRAVRAAGCAYAPQPAAAIDAALGGREKHGRLRDPRRHRGHRPVRPRRCPVARGPDASLEVVTVSLPRPRNVLSVPDCEGFAELHARLQRLLFGEQV